ncbi:hypothetical protein LOZ45_000624 [Ophidiomyces ophidiicola]|nr:hypothetical protein LOZ45_000624 [Ophidiomyces ophidiicola]KAI2194441.1 hypothetical protein LOZ21_000252 [Ophidiomyces ophidiicola]KAI2340745.1 hypothetical protein LOY96_000333 [Ophidiomyces ophidiicola]KAI2376323.1 hypothetical protein LOY93_000288 [Ophidiomyces ophidiicola]KAI2447209.1 hypothetical protein LOZ30_001579 [Ophidiomyces ophidiicola]
MAVVQRRRVSFHAEVDATDGTLRATKAVKTTVRTITWDDLPHWLRDNPHIHSGYRPASASFVASFKSLTYVHNETVNIYSHLLPSLLSLPVFFTIYTAVSSRYESASYADIAVFSCFFAGAAFCLGMSAIYHTISNHSPFVAYIGNACDYVGIVGLIVGSFVPKHRNPETNAMAPQDRLAQVSSHLNYPQGMLHGQVAIITGAGQGIGAEAAHLFANEGAKVVVADLDARTYRVPPIKQTGDMKCLTLLGNIEKCEAVAKAINDASARRAIAVAGDVTDSEYLKRLVQKAAEFGNGKIHIIVNNAGYTWDGVIHKLSDTQWEKMLAVHATAPFKLVQLAAPFFRVKDGEPRVIVNISSTSGIHGNAGQANYALAKAGVVGLTKTIAKEWGPQFGVRANTIAFGFVLTRLTQAKEAGAFITTPEGHKVALGIPTKQLSTKKGDEQDQYADIPLRRAASPAEAARSILGVVSPLFSYVNGQTIMVTGGRNM